MLAISILTWISWMPISIPRFPNLRDAKVWWSYHPASFILATPSVSKISWICPHRCLDQVDLDMQKDQKVRVLLHFVLPFNEALGKLSWHDDMMTCMEVNMFFSTVLQWAQALAKDEVLLFQSGFSQPLPAENAAGTGDGCTKSNKSQNK